MLRELIETLREAVQKVSSDDAKRIGDELKVDWKKIPLAQFRRGIEVEQEHADVTRGNLTTSGRIAHAHLKERPDYYTRLDRCVEN